MATLAVGAEMASATSSRAAESVSSTWHGRYRRRLSGRDANNRDRNNMRHYSTRRQALRCCAMTFTDYRAREETRGFADFLR